MSVCIYYFLLYLACLCDFMDLKWRSDHPLASLLHVQVSAMLNVSLTDLFDVMCDSQYGATWDEVMRLDRE